MQGNKQKYLDNNSNDSGNKSVKEIVNITAAAKLRDPIKILFVFLGNKINIQPIIVDKPAIVVKRKE